MVLGEKLLSKFHKVKFYIFLKCYIVQNLATIFSFIICNSNFKFVRLKLSIFSYSKINHSKGGLENAFQQT